MTRYRKKPIVVEASRWFHNGDHPDDKVGKTTYPVDGSTPYEIIEGRVVRFFRHPEIVGHTPCQHCGIVMHLHGWIDTLEGGHTVCPGDWIITGVKGERYPCKPDIFVATYGRDLG